MTKTEPNQKKRKWVLGKNKEYGDRERKKERKKLDKKLSRMKKIKFRSKKRNKGDNIEIPLPDIIKEYGDLSIFKVKDEERRIAGRAPPVILGDIKLSREEEELLSLGPKFTVAEEEVNETDLIEELEKALVKLKIGLIEETEAIKKREEEEAEYGRSGKTVEETQEEKEERKWESVKRTQVMDFENNTWDLGRLRPTGMKYNKRMKLPKGGDRGIEAEFEIRRVVEEHNTRVQKRNEESREMKERGDKKKEDDGKRMSNLSTEMNNALKRLKKRCKKEGIIIARTDKSGRFCVLKKDRYLRAGMKQKEKVRDIDMQEVRERQKVLNGHARWITEALNIGASHGEKAAQRCKQNMIEEGGEVPAKKVA